MANNNTSAIIVVMVAVCLIATAIPVLIVATQDNGGGSSETTVITIVSAPDGDPVDWSLAVTAINGWGIEYLTAELGDDSESIVCTVTGPVTAGTFGDDVYDALFNQFGGNLNDWGPENFPMYDTNAPGLITLPGGLRWLNNNK